MSETEPTGLAPEQIEEFLAHVDQVLRDEGIEVIDVPGEKQEGGVETQGSRHGRRLELLKSPAYDPVRMYLKLECRCGEWAIDFPDPP